MLTNDTNEMKFYMIYELYDITGNCTVFTKQSLADIA